MIRIRRAYEEPTSQDGKRFLIDRLWPRGIRKENLVLDGWLKEAAPSNELRRWYHQDSQQWEAFRQRYYAELEKNPESWQPLLEAARKGNITLVYSARNEEQNNAVALKEFLEAHL